MERIGLFGGAFDPPHNEHIDFCNAAYKALNLSRLIIIPTFIPPHKEVITSYIDRVAMARLSFVEPYNDISLIESELSPPSYTVKVLHEIIAREKNEYVYIIGADSLISIFQWFKPEELFELVPIAVCGRSLREEELSFAIKKATLMGARIQRVAYEGSFISSSLVRGLAELNLDLTHYTSKNVANYIKENNLYTEHNDIVARVRLNLSKKRFDHTTRVLETALKLSSKYYCAYDKVFISALLHDIDKEKECTSYEGIADYKDVAHQFNGAIVAQKEFHIEDQEILNAIKYHSTARANMTRLDKLIYVSDMIEPERMFIGVDKLRESVYNDLDSGFVMCLEYTINYLRAQVKRIYPLSLEAEKEYL